ncbi:MAG: hypothetical protein V5A25_07185 [Halovenus sp.]
MPFGCSDGRRQVAAGVRAVTDVLGINAGELGELPCWPCDRDGFDTPNPSTGEE